MTLERMNLSGAIIDLDVLDALDVQHRLAREEARDRLVRLAGTAGVSGFTPTNDSHIRDLLFNKLGLPNGGKTKTGKFKVDKDTLKGIDHDAVRTLLDYNSHDKLYSVNILGARANLSPLTGVLRRGYLPFRINPLGARTGRRSASNPNSQNWPKAVRGMVCSRWVGGQILNADYKKLEVVLLAWLSGDDKLLSYFTTGKGYIDVAKELFGYDITQESDTYRAVKSIVLGVHYNMQTPKMARQLELLGIRFSPDWGEHEAETDRVRRLYLRRFAGIGRYMRRRDSEWRQSGTSTSYTGRVRHLAVHPGMSRGEHGHLLNQAINFPVQSLAADVTASAMMDIEYEFMGNEKLSYSQYLAELVEQRKNMLTKGLDHDIILPMSQIINEVHDSLVVDLHPEHVARDTEIIIECMRAVRSLKQLAPGFDTSILGVDAITDHHWRS
jgi:DNA polymerase-1